MFKKLFFLVIIVILIFPTFSSLLRPGYFPMHDDMQAMRLLQMDKCVKDGQIPCRWVPDMGYGYGYPQFNYYAPLPYYIMEGFHLAGLGYLDSVKAGFVVSVVVAAVGMYLLGKSLWGSKAGGIISAIFYSYANYRAVDMYVRGAMGEIWALAFLPFIFWSVYKVFEGNKKSVLWMALSLAALFTSHNVSTLIFAPVIALWIGHLFLFYADSPIRQKILNLKSLIISILWGFSLSAFFILPAWFEKKYVHVETLLQGYFNYLAHFVSIKQLLFSSYFNYGASDGGVYDEMSLSVGILHWLIPLLIVVLLLLLKKWRKLFTSVFFVLIGWIALFMTHLKSSFIWEQIGILEYLQFPWRFLTVATFAFSVATGALAILLNSNKTRIVIVLFIASVFIFFNSSFFQPFQWLNISDQDKFSGESWEKQLTISIFDYLPIYAKTPPVKKAPDRPHFVDGHGEVVMGVAGTYWQLWTVEVEEGDIMILPIIYFPNWQVRIDGEEVRFDFNNELGLINFPITQGTHDVSAKLVNTPVRSYADLLTLMGLLAIPVYVYKLKKHLK